MAERTALADRSDIDAELPSGQTVGEQEPGSVAIAPAEPLVAEELLVEEVSIDGMCGVY